VGSEEGMKLLPVRVSVRVALPGAAEPGEREGLRTGKGLGGGLMMNAIGLERPLS